MCVMPTCLPSLRSMYLPEEYSSLHDVLYFEIIQEQYHTILN